MDLPMYTWFLGHFCLEVRDCPVTGKDGELCPGFPSQFPGLQPFETIPLSSISLTVHIFLSTTRLWVLMLASHVV